MKIDDIDVPTNALITWRRLLAEVDDSRLAEWAADYKNFIPGFRPGKIPGQAVRGKLIAMLEHQGPMPEPLRSALQRLGITQSIINVFSEDVIRATAPNLHAYYGDLAFAAMLLDDRDDVRMLGYEKLQHSVSPLGEAEGQEKQSLRDETSPTTRTAASARLAGQLRPFIRDFTKIILDAKANDDTADKEESTEGETESIRALNDTLSKLESDLKRSKSHAEKLESTLVLKEQELLKAKRSRDIAKENLSTTSDALTSLEAELEKRVSDSINHRLNERLRPWLSSLMAQERLSQSTSKDALLTTVSEVLRRQAEIDKQYGTIQKLEGQLEDLRGAREKLQSALDYSIQPRREIPSLISRIDQEIDTLEQHLGRKERPELSPFTTQLCSEIKLADSLETLSEIRTRVMRTSDSGGLSSVETKTLFEIILERTDQLYCSALIESSRTWHHESFLGLPGNHLRALISDRLHCRLIIDGHNLLFSLDDLYGDFYEGGTPKALAREELAKRSIRLVEQFQSVVMDIWFDGPELTNKTMHENLRVHFSGGHGTDRADDSIVAFLRALKSEEISVTFVVTNDRALRERCNTIGARVIACDEIASLLGQ